LKVTTGDTERETRGEGLVWRTVLERKQNQKKTKSEKNKANGENCRKRAWSSSVSTCCDPCCWVVDYTAGAGPWSAASLRIPDHLRNLADKKVKKRPFAWRVSVLVSF